MRWLVLSAMVVSVAYIVLFWVAILLIIWDHGSDYRAYTKQLEWEQRSIDKQRWEWRDDRWVRIR